MITFGEKLKHLRKKNHLTQKQLGILIGFSEGCVDIRIVICLSLSIPQKGLLKAIQKQSTSFFLLKKEICYSFKTEHSSPYFKAFNIRICQDF